MPAEPLSGPSLVLYACALMAVAVFVYAVAARWREWRRERVVGAILDAADCAQWLAALPRVRELSPAEKQAWCYRAAARVSDERMERMFGPEWRI